MARAPAGRKETADIQKDHARLFVPTAGIFASGQAIGRMGGKPITETLAKKLVKEVGQGGKSFAEQAFPTTVRVQVKIPKIGGGFQRFVSEVKGLNQTHALQRAEANWEGAQISLLNTIKNSATKSKALAPGGIKNVK